MFRKVCCFFFFPDLGFILFYFIFSKRFLRGKKLWFQEDILPQDILQLCKKSVFPKFSSQIWKYFLFVHFIYFMTAFLFSLFLGRHTRAATGTVLLT